MTTPKSHQRRGKGFESDLVTHLRSQGYDAERLPLAGTKDQGDIVVRKAGGIYVVIEAKAPGASNRIDLSGWIKEAKTEAANFAAARNLPATQVSWLLVIKARGKSLDQAYTIQELINLFPQEGETNV